VDSKKHSMVDLSIHYKEMVERMIFNISLNQEQLTTIKACDK
jgi:hypothetical protein